MLTSLLRFIFTLPENIKRSVCLHKWEYLTQDPSDWHSLCECRKCGKTTSNFPQHLK